jgi:hypothetical protein
MHQGRSSFKLKMSVGQDTSRLWAVLRGHCPILEPQDAARGLNRVRLLVVACNRFVLLQGMSLFGTISINF